MTEMIERVARALWRLDNPVEDGFSQAAPNDWDLWPNTGRQASLAQVDHSRDDYREQARAAIAAMRNPTANMKEVGGDVYDYIEDKWDNAEASWNAMIDAALQEPTP